jgi:hypothetical protein
MPSIGYTYFSRENDLARLWGRYMPISAEKYFSFNLPAVIFLGFSFFTFRSGYRDDAIVIDRLVERINESVVKINPAAIIILTSASLFAYGVSGALPAALSQVNTFLYFSLFAGAFYIVFYKGFPYRWYFIGGIVFFVLWDAVKHSMFTIIAYMGGLFMILRLAGRRVTAGQKIIMLIIAVVFMGFVQLFKLDLRRSRIMGYDPGVYEVATRVIASSRKAGPEDLLFPMYYRMNQGFNIALVQRRIPERVDYLGGGYLAISFISAFVPRLFWEDKPEAGGKSNMRLYTGIELKNWSTNVGPLGEAYGNFGYVGGWIYIFMFGLFLRFTYFAYLRICENMPLFFLWMPAFLFQAVYVMETDSLQGFNSIIKGAVFLFLMYKLFPKLFGAK